MLLRAAFNPAAIERKNGSDCISIAMFEPRDEQRNDKNETRSDDYDVNENENEENIPF